MDSFRRCWRTLPSVPKLTDSECRLEVDFSSAQTGNRGAYAGAAFAAMCRTDPAVVSPAITRKPIPANTAPISGAIQKSQSCDSAQLPTTIAGPVLRAGFTEVLVTGMLIK